MFSGMKLWNEDVTRNMYLTRIGDKKLWTYKNMPRNLYEALKKNANRMPEKAAFIDNWGREYSYGNFIEKVDKFAQYLYEEEQIHKGDRVALMLFNGIEFCVAYLSLTKIGAVTCPLPSKYKEPEVNALAKKAEVKLIICDRNFYSWFNDFCKEKNIERIQVDSVEEGYGLEAYLTNGTVTETSLPELTDDVIIMFTSGTTSVSKGVVLKNYNVMHAAYGYKGTLRLSEEEVGIIPVPIYHITGMSALLGTFLVIGGTLVLHTKFEARRVLQAVQEYGITYIHCAPTVFVKLLDEKENFPSLPSLRVIGCGGAYIAKEKIKAYHQWLPNVKFHTIFGMTETTSPGTVFPGDMSQHQLSESCGWPIPGLACKVVDEMGEEVPNGIAGEICMSGNTITDRYLDTGNELITEDGWLHTGDVGYLTDEGFLFICDRKKDIINRGAEKVPSVDVEKAIYELDSVKETAVVGIPHEFFGEVVAAVISCKQGYELTEEQVKEFLSYRLANYKIPVKILFMENIPKTVNSKIDKKYIKTLF